MLVYLGPPDGVVARLDVAVQVADRVQILIITLQCTLALPLYIHYIKNVQYDIMSYEENR